MSSPDRGDGKSITVLHVDDDPDFLDVAAQFLEREDPAIEVLSATGAERALDRLAEDDVDCVVSDHDMPRMDGLELFERVRERDPAMPFVLFTGKGSEAVASEAVSAGVTDYLQKETGTDQYAILANRIRNAVEGNRSRERARRRRDRLERVLTVVPMSVFQVDRDGKVVFANERAKSVDGAEQVVTGTAEGDAWNLRTLEGDPVPEAARPLRRIVDTGEPIEGVQYALVGPDGERRVFEISGAPLFEDGEVDSVVFATADVTEQRDRERMLERTTEQLELILDNVPLVVAAIDEEGVFRLSRGRGLAKLGLAAGEVVGKSVFDIYAGQPDIVEDCRRALDGERLHDTVETGGRTFEVWYEPVAESGSTDYSVVIVAVDVTGRVMRQRELERYETVVEASGDPVYALDADGRFTFVNDAAAEMTGYDADYLRGRHASTVIDRDDVEAGERLIRELLSSDRDRGTYEMALLTADGERIPVENHIALLPHEEEFRGTVGVLRDITDRKRHESTLEGLNRVADEIQDEGTIEGVCRRTVETAEQLLDFNMCSILVREGEWLVPYAESEGAPPGGSRRMRIDQGLAGRTYQSGESFVVGEVEPDDPTDPAKPSYRSGISVPVGEHGVFQAVDTETGAFDERDRTLAELLATHAATAIERIEREASLTRQNARLEEFVGLLSHDARNPLNVAADRLALAREECDSEHLDGVARAHRRIEQLIDNMLALAGEGEAVSETEPVALGDLIDECWSEVGSRDATLHVETDATILADPSRLRQLVENLLRNAVEHGSTSPRSQAPEDAVEHGSTSPDSQAPEDADSHSLNITVGDLPDGFYVEDDGPGIPEEARESVFEAGYSTDPGGTGFGLRIVDGIATAHGWDVAVTEGTDGGARFEITGVEHEDDRRESSK